MLTFKFTVVRRILASFYQYLGGDIESDNLGFRDEEQHDELLAHDSQGLVFSVCRGYKGDKGIKKDNLPLERLDLQFAKTISSYR